EHAPWRELPSLRRTVESKFLRPAYLGECIAPYRVLTRLLAVVPWDADSGALLDAGSAADKGYVHLAEWLEEVERLWNANQDSGMTFLDQIDYYGKLRAQLPPVRLRVVYAASGTLPAAAILTDAEAVVAHGLYWAAVEGPEARYVEAIL